MGGVARWGFGGFGFEILNLRLGIGDLNDSFEERKERGLQVRLIREPGQFVLPHDEFSLRPRRRAITVGVHSTLRSLLAARAC